MYLCFLEVPYHQENQVVLPVLVFRLYQLLQLIPVDQKVLLIPLAPQDQLDQRVPLDL